jgi:hypothetical protein
VANVVASSETIPNYLKRKPDFDVGRNTTTNHMPRVMKNCTNSFHELETLKKPYRW